MMHQINGTTKIMFYLTCLILLSVAVVIEAIPKKPHIFIIMADDMGFNDIGFHGSNQIPTPNIDAILSYGIAFRRHYSETLCTPCRASLLTGKYSSNLGMQHYVIGQVEPWGLDLKEKILPQYLKEAGYKTHIVGKWHLGFFERKYTPTQRGFDSHFGYYGGFIDYYNHSVIGLGVVGYDMRNNLKVDYDSRGLYATDLFSDVAVNTIKAHDKNIPMFMYLTHLAPHSGRLNDGNQAPEDEIAKFSYIKDLKRRKYAAMVSRLDQGIGRVVKAIKEQNMLDNSVILFFSDNGAPTVGGLGNSGSNYPFKGQKDSPWEGGFHTVGGIWSPHLQKKERVTDDLIHITDWLPTLTSLAGIKIDTPLDGKNIWDSLAFDGYHPRKELLGHLDDTVPFSTYIMEQWKYIKGTTCNGLNDGWLSVKAPSTENHSSFNNYGRSVQNSDAGQAFAKYCSNGSGPLSATKIESLRYASQISCNDVPIPAVDSPLACNPLQKPCLFNIIDDPCERVNLAEKEPLIVKMIEERINLYRGIALPPRNQPNDPCGNPAYYNNTVSWWLDEPSPLCVTTKL